MKTKLYFATIILIVGACNNSKNQDPCDTESLPSTRVSSLNFNPEAESSLNELTYILRPLNYVSTDRDYVGDIPKSRNIDFFFELTPDNKTLYFIENNYRKNFTSDIMYRILYEVELDQLSPENIYLQTFTGKDIFFGEKPLGKVNLVTRYNNPEGVLRKHIKYTDGEAEIISCEKTDSFGLLMNLNNAQALEKELINFLDNV